MSEPSGVLQGTFDRVARHLLSQGRRSTTPLGRCRYRGVDGCRCAIGCLIDDPNYSPDLEDWSVDEAMVRTAVERSFGRDLVDREAVLLLDMQRVHDGEEVRDWRLALGRVAKVNGLDASAATRDPC